MSADTSAATMSSPPSLVELAKQILADAGKLEDFLRDNNLPQPSLTEDGGFEFTKGPEKVVAAQRRLRESSKLLHDLVQGPRELVRWLPYEYLDCTAMHHVAYYKLVDFVPTEGSISYDELARVSNTPFIQTRRAIRLAITLGLFREPQPGVVAHSSASRLLATDPYHRAVFDFGILDGFPSGARAVEAQEKWGFSGEPTQTAFNVAFDTPLPMFQYWATHHPDRMERFSKAMGELARDPAYDFGHLANGFDWASLGEGKVVDVGGSVGHVSACIAERHPSLNFIVQDLPDLLPKHRVYAQDLAPAIRTRIAFQAHNFFEPQPVHDADVYLLRMIIHNRSDQYSMQIIRNIASSMKPGARIVIMDSVLPTPGVLPASEDRKIRFTDLHIGVVLNCQQREIDDWNKLFQKADQRLKLEKVVKPVGSAMSVFELSLRDTAALANL